jgi:hypothetical protein
MGIFFEYLFPLGNKNKNNDSENDIDNNIETKVLDDKNNYLNKKTKRDNYNINDNDISNNKKVKYQTEINNKNEENMIEEIYNISIENNKILKQLLNQNTSFNKNYFNNNEYSFEVINPDLRDIVSYPPKGVKNLIFDLVLKNNGNKDWPENSTKLNIDKNATGFDTDFNEIKIGYLKVGMIKKVKININVLGELEEKKYQLVLYFSVNNKVYGNKIYINFQVKEDKCDDFRAKFLISDELVSNTQIRKSLKQNQNDDSKAYMDVMNFSIQKSK